MNFNKIAKTTVGLCVAIGVLFSSSFIKSDEAFTSPYTDLSAAPWCVEAVNCLYYKDILPKGGDQFYPNVNAHRQDLVMILYNLAIATGVESSEIRNIPAEPLPFVDVYGDESTYYKPISWAYKAGIVTGYSDNTFDPHGECSREALCTMIMRYLTYAGVKPQVVGNQKPFRDSMKVRMFARSYVVASKMAGFIEGDENGCFRPRDSVTRAELAQIVYNMYISATSGPVAGAELVDTSADAYTNLYGTYATQLYQGTVDPAPKPDANRETQTAETQQTRPHEAYINETPEVDASYFDDAVFVGDSVSMSLQFYCASSRALGNATFLCVGSLSPLNAHWEVSADSKHPVYNGQKLTVEDAVAAVGKKKVYILLGINSLSFGVDRCVEDMENLIKKIQTKSPDAKIIIQSVTPMTSDSPITSSSLNNKAILEFNEKILNSAQKNGWYYVNVAQAVRDENNNLRRSYCSDPDSMGIHFNFEADKAWVNYLKTHAPSF